MKIKQFDPHIYPQKLWVCIEKDFKKLNGLFSDVDDNTDLDFGKYDNFQAVTINVIEKETRDFGVLIIFRPKYLDCKTIAHESSHATGYMFHHIGADMDCGEPTAYLIGWIAGCCWRCKIRKWN
jgi:hypothetical protein